MRYEDVTDGRVVELGVHHTIDGNRGRFSADAVRLDEDVRWRTQLAAQDRALALALTAPLLVRYGYLPRAASSSSASVLETI